jgi:hypothetical protein
MGRYERRDNYHKRSILFRSVYNRYGDIRWQWWLLVIVIVVAFIVQGLVTVSLHYNVGVEQEAIGTVNQVDLLYNRLFDAKTTVIRIRLTDMNYGVVYLDGHHTDIVLDTIYRFRYRVDNVGPWFRTVQTPIVIEQLE